MNGLAVGLGAALGAWLRWGITILCQTTHNSWPISTLVVNICGGFLAGIAIGFFEQHAHLNEVWRLFIITGLLGGLTTFSAFSIEILFFLRQEEYVQALGYTSLQLIGSITLCIAGWWSYRMLFN